jgi:hypothetical protein
MSNILKYTTFVVMVLGRIVALSQPATYLYSWIAGWKRIRLPGGSFWGGPGGLMQKRCTFGRTRAGETAELCPGYLWVKSASANSR